MIGVSGERRAVYAHRLSFEIHWGAIPAGLEVCHTCDNPACVRPDHLFAATHRENLQDASSKGRTAFQRHPEKAMRGDKHYLRINPSLALRGEDANGAILTETDVAEIRRSYASGESTQVDLGKKYGVDRTTIGRIVRQRTWRHLLNANSASQATAASY